MPLYESTFIARQDLSRQDVGKLADSLASIIEQGGGKVVKNEYWGLRNLAYRIRKHRKGHYGMLAIDASAETVKEMRRNIGHNEDIVRSLTVRVETVEDGPSIMMQQSRGHETYAAEAEAEIPVDIAPIDETLI